MKKEIFKELNKKASEKEDSSSKKKITQNENANRFKRAKLVTKSVKFKKEETEDIPYEIQNESVKVFLGSIGKLEEVKTKEDFDTVLSGYGLTEEDF